MKINWTTSHEQQQQLDMLTANDNIDIINAENMELKHNIKDDNLY